MASLDSIRTQFPQYDDMSDGDLLMALHRRFYSDVHPRAFLNSIDGAQNAHVTIENPTLKAYWKESVQKPMEGEDEAAMRRRLSGSAEGPVGDPGGRFGAAARSALQGLTFGGGDEIVAAGQSALSGMSYDDALKAERDRLALGQQQYPASSMGAEVVGAVAAPAAVLKGGGSLAAQAARSAGVAGAEGLAYGFNAGEGGAANRARNAVDTAKWSAGIGALAPVAGRTAKKIYDASALKKAIKQAGKSAPSIDELRDMAARIYAQADQVNNLPRDEFGTSVRQITSKASRAGMDADLTPQASKVASRMADAAGDPSPTIGFREVDTLRRKAAVPAGNVQNRVEAALGSGMVEGLDEYVQNVDPSLSAEISKAREMWGRLRRSEAVDEAFDKARRQASGFENGIRIQFRSILNNKKLRRGFTDAEIKAMEAVVEGTRFGNIMRKVGKMGVGLGQQSNFLGASIGTGGGAAIGSLFGPIGAGVGGVLAPAIGTAAQYASDRATQKAAQGARGLIASGGAASVPALSQGAVGLLEDLVRRSGRGVEAVK